MELEEPQNSTNFYRVQREKSDDGRSISSFEKVLENVGSEDRFQKIIICGLILPVSICNALTAFKTPLLLSTPNHSCHVPGRPSINVAFEEWKNLTIPWEENSSGGLKLSSCCMFNISTHDFSNKFNASENDGISTYFGDTLDSNRSIVECQHGWDFGNSVRKETPVTQFGWVCEDKYIVTQLFSLTYAGFAVGSLFFSFISDRLGRKRAFYIVLSLDILCSAPLIFAPNLAVYGVFTFFLSLSFGSLSTVTYVIVTELCGERHRAATTVISSIGSVIGQCLVSIFDYLIHQWKIFIVVCHLPSIVFFLYCRVLPESPRWLLSHSKVDECEEILKRIARINGRTYTEESRRLLLQAQGEETRKGSLKDILKSFVLAKHLALTCILLSITFATFSGMQLNIHNMKGSKAVNFAILAVVAIPGNVMAGISSQYLGRRLSIAIFSGLTAVSCILATSVLQNQWALTALCAAVKMFTGASIFVVFMQIGELFPTSLRATAYGIAIVISATSIIFIPHVIALGTSKVFLPYYIFFGIQLLALFLSSFLPETVGRPLPQSLSEAVCIGRNQPFFSLIHKWNAHKYLDRPQQRETFNLRSEEEEKMV